MHDRSHAQCRFGRGGQMLVGVGHRLVGVGHTLVGVGIG